MKIYLVDNANDGHHKVYQDTLNKINNTQILNKIIKFTDLKFFISSSSILIPSPFLSNFVAKRRREIRTGDFSSAIRAICFAQKQIAV